MSKTVVDENKIDELFQRYTETVFPSMEKAKEILKSGNRLTFYLGIDPTGPDIHLGHVTNLILLKKIINLGHEVILLIGDFTARIGDPTGKDTARRALSEGDVKKNMQGYLDQVRKILPAGSFEVKHNSKWLKKMNLEDVIKLASRFTVQQMIVRDMFQKRLEEQKPISLHEFLYPLLQGYDSVAMKVDGEIGGNDQTFNMLAGRELAKEILGKEKIVITTKLLEDPVTGKKLMSKSEGSYVALNDLPEEMFGKVMAMPDSSILPLLKLSTEVSEEKIKEAEQKLKNGENPKNIKEMLAFELVSMCHGEKLAQKAKEEFRSIFSEHQIPENMQEIEWKGDIANTAIFAGIVGSRAEIKRLIEQKAVRLDGKVVENWNEGAEIKIKEEGSVLKVGPRRFYKVKIK